MIGTLATSPLTAQCSPLTTLPLTTLYPLLTIHPFIHEAFGALVLWVFGSKYHNYVS